MLLAQWRCKFDAAKSSEIPEYAEKLQKKPPRFNNLDGCAWQGMRDSNPRKRSQSPVCYRYTNPLYFGSDTEQRLLLYAEPAKCQEEISNFARIFFRRLLLRRNWEPGIV